MDELLELPAEAIDFMEVAPENWIDIGGARGRRFANLASRQPLLLHGLSLNIGGPTPLDVNLIDKVREFMGRYDCPLYSEHLTSCGDEHGHLYDLMPIPFTVEAARYVIERVNEVQERLGQRIALENASYYAPLANKLDELEFINAVLDGADCSLLLDINNIYVNSLNHGYEAEAFLSALPAHRIAYLHIAGHYIESADLRVDTHGSEICEPVWQLLEVAYQSFGVKPTLLERDSHFPPISALLEEMARIRALQAACQRHAA